MQKVTLFLKLHKKVFVKNVILLFLFFFACIVVSASLYIKENNAFFHDTLYGNSYNREEYGIIFKSVEDILGVLALLTITIAAWGGTTLIIYRDLMLQKTYAVCRLYGMEKRDMLYKALTDMLLFGILAGSIGSILGYCFFTYIAKSITGIEAQINFLSASSLRITIVVIMLLATVAFFSSLVGGIVLFKKPIVSVFYEREASVKNKKAWVIGGIGIVLVVIEMKLLYPKNPYMFPILFGFILLNAILLLAFRLFFQKIGKIIKKRNAIKNIKGISYRFLGVRKERNAIMASTISVGTILLCFILNIVLNVSAILEEAYRENMGYNTLIWVDAPKEQEVLEKLNQKEYKYTLLYSKLMDYSELGERTEGKFWACIVKRRTDNNPHFWVEDGSFVAENYFASKTRLLPNGKSKILGKELVYKGPLQTSQALSLINYSFVVGYNDWDKEIDESYKRAILLDIHKTERKQIEKELEGTGCKIQTAGSVVESIQELMKKYFSIISMIAIMLIMVTALFFYSIIQNDMLTRQKELFLYQVFGASKKQRNKVVFYEYLILAFLVSFSVISLVALLGEVYFYYMLQKHYPLSIPVIMSVTLCVDLFILLCCKLADLFADRKEKYTFIRDE